MVLSLYGLIIPTLTHELFLSISIVYITVHNSPIIFPFKSSPFPLFFPKNFSPSNLAFFIPNFPSSAPPSPPLPFPKYIRYSVYIRYMLYWPNMAFGKKKLNYKGVPVNFFGLPVFGKNSKKIEPKNTPSPARSAYMRSFFKTAKTDSPKNLLLLYDIPENRKKERDWFRRQLKSFGFIMIQKSVWIGPSPLPPDFIAYIEEIGLKSQFKTFKLAKPYSISMKVNK